MKRRKFITLAGGVAIAWPLAARAQQSAIPVIGFLNSQSPDGYPAERLRAFHEGLKETNYVEGVNVGIEYRWARGQYDQLPALAADLVRRQASVIAATGGNEAASAAKRATSTIPIVFTAGGDPVRAGLVASLNRPEGNATGVTPFTRQLGPKQLGLLRAIVPRSVLIAVLVNRANLDADIQLGEIEEASQSLGLQILPLKINDEQDLERAFATIASRSADALLVVGGAFFTPHRVELAVLTARHAIPAIYPNREFAVAGGLMSYGSDLANAYRQVGIYVGRILKGEKPADLPVMQPTKFQFVINLKTAKALNLITPPTLLALADEVIE